MSENLQEENEGIHPNRYHLRDNQEIRQIMGRPPGKLLYWGITAVLVGVMVLLVISYVIRYPDVIPARVQILTENPPIRLVAKKDGNISSLFVLDQQLVKTGQLLGVLESTAQWEDIVLLDSFLLRLPETYAAMRTIQLPSGLNVGALQTSFSGITQKIEDYNIFIKQNISTQKRNSLETQIQHFEALNESLSEQKETAQELLDIVVKDVNRKKGLLAEGIAAETELEQAQTTFLQAKRQFESLNIGIINNNIKIEELKMLGLEILQNNNQSNNTQLLAVQQNLNSLRSEVDRWKFDHLLQAPIAGKVSMDRIWSSQQFVQGNEAILTIVPEQKSGKLIGKAMLPLNRSGKVKEDMRVNIRLDGYPYQEFGSIPATVKNMSLVPTEGAYLVELKIPEVLETTYGEIIPFQQEMQGTANIITEDRRILDRIFDKVWSLLKNR